MADHVIPANENMPSASQVKVAGDLLDRVLELLPDLAETLSRVFVRDVEHPEEWIDELSVVDPEGYRAVLLAIAASYYLDKGVRRLIGYPGHPSIPVRAHEIPEYVTEDLLEKVIANWGHSEIEEAT